MTNKFKVGDKVEYIGDVNMFEGIGTIIETVVPWDYDSYIVKTINGETTCMESSLKKVDDPIQLLKDEIAEKQRELATLVRESERNEYHFVSYQDYTWEEAADIIKKSDNGAGFICEVERNLDTNSVMINLEINYNDKVNGKYMLKEA